MRSAGLKPPWFAQNWFVGDLPRVRTIHVAGGVHDDDAREDGPGGGGAEQGFESRVVFLRRHAVDAGAVRDESGKVLEGLGKMRLL